MMKLRRFTVLTCAVLLLAACARSGPPAPVEMRGVGAGETRPGSYGTASHSSTSPEPIMGGTYSPPPGYGSTTGSGIQAQSLGEPNDPYAQAAVAPAHGQIATQTPPVGSYPQSQPQPQVLGTMPQTTSIPATTPVMAPSAAPSASEVQGSGEFGWPLRGRLISGFGPKPDGQKNEGLNIAAPMGTSVFASKDGTVAYAGNELRGFGNMVLVRHSAGMFTVYGHLDQISVSKGAAITKGQVVGTVGQSGGVTEPQLHFEVRQNSTPQDPMRYLGR